MFSKAKRAILVPLVLFASSIAPGHVHAQGLNGFLPSPGHATVALSHTFESYDEYWEGGVLISDPTLGKVETGTMSLWIDIGLLENLALAANLAYVGSASDGPTPQREEGLQDRTFHLRYRFLSLEGDSFNHRFLASAGYRAPLAPYDPNRFVSIGDNTNDALFRLIYQLEMPNLLGAYLSTEFGYDIRNELAPDGMSFYGELGATYGKTTAGIGVLRTLADGGDDLGQPTFSFPGLGGRCSGSAESSTTGSPRRSESPAPPSPPSTGETWARPPGPPSPSWWSSRGSTVRQSCPGAPGRPPVSPPHSVSPAGPHPSAFVDRVSLPLGGSIFRGPPPPADDESRTPCRNGAGEGRPGPLRPTDYAMISHSEIWLATGGNTSPPCPGP